MEQTLNVILALSVICCLIGLIAALNSIIFIVPFIHVFYAMILNGFIIASVTASVKYVSDKQEV